MSIILPNGGTPNLGAQSNIAGGGNPLMGGMQTVDFGQFVASIAAQVFEQMTISSIRIKVKKLYDDSVIPTYESKMAGCADLYAHLIDTESVVIPPHTTVKIGTGVAFELPEGFSALIYARSGISSKEGLRPANCTGYVDSDYRGEVIVALHNDSDETRVIEHGQRIAQVSFTNYHQADFEEVNTLSETKRGDGGFGHSGK